MEKKEGKKVEEDDEDDDLYALINKR